MYGEKLIKKEIVSVISSDPLCKENNARFTTVLLKHLNVRRVQSYVCFNLSKTTWIPLQILVCAMLSYNLNLQLNTSGFRKVYLCTRRMHKGFKGTVVNRTFPSLHGGSLEI